MDDIPLYYEKWIKKPAAVICGFLTGVTKQGIRSYYQHHFDVDFNTDYDIDDMWFEKEELLELLKDAPDDLDLDKYYYEYTEEELKKLPRIEIPISMYSDVVYHKKDKVWYFLPSDTRYGVFDEFDNFILNYNGNLQKLNHLFDMLEKYYHSESQVIKFMVNVANTINNTSFIFAVNDIFEERGYKAYIEQKHSHKEEKFDIKKYKDLMTNTTRSASKTEKLINYLYRVNDINLTISSMHHINFKYLVDLYNFDYQRNSYLKKCYDNRVNLYELLFEDKPNNKSVCSGIRIVEQELLYKLGGFDMFCAENTYEKFVLEVEKLLTSIGFKKYMYINALKVKVGIIDKEVVSIYSTIDEYLEKNMSDIIKMIDKKKLRNFVKEAKKYTFEYPTGYLMLTNLLIKQIEGGK